MDTITMTEKRSHPTTMAKMEAGRQKNLQRAAASSTKVTSSLYPRNATMASKNTTPPAFR